MNEEVTREVEKVDGGVIIVCYGQIQAWKVRQEAVAFYWEAMRNSDGAENARYQNIFYDLMQKNKVCWDGVTDSIENTVYR